MTDIERERIINICSTYIPYFENVDPKKACTWSKSKKRDDGVIVLGHPEYDVDFLKFINIVTKSGLLIVNYTCVLEQRVPNWHSTNFAKIMEVADYEIVRAVLTMCVRHERFCDGSWGNAIRNGLFLQILHKLREFVDNGTL